MEPHRSPNRWLIAIMGTALMLCLGTVYAWSYFQKPLMEAYGWTNAQVALAFSLAILFLGLAAAGGGLLLPKYGPRKLAVTGGLLFGAGYLLAALALHWHSLPLLYVGYGLIGGVGLGLGYVTPVATAAKWFPDRKGLVTGMVVMGFGFGALLMSKVLAPVFMAWTGGNLVTVFAVLGVLFAALAAGAAAFLRNPPEGWTPAGGVPGATSKAGGAPAPQDDPALTTARCVFSGRFAMMWAIFFCNITAGIAIISFQSPLLQDLWGRKDPLLSKAALAAYGATLIAVSSLFNGAGRFLWGGLSDRWGRVQVFRVMLLTQILAFLGLCMTENPWLFGALVCYVLLCYGGGFGTMPAFILDVFGAKRMAAVYGAILTAWSAAGLAGPQIVAALKDRCGEKAAGYAFLVAAAFLGVGLLLSLFVTNRRFQPAGAQAEA